MQPKLIMLCGLLFATPSPVYAYVGPGLATGTIGAVLGILGGILLAIFAVVYYPVKRMLQKKKNIKSPDATPPKP